MKKQQNLIKNKPRIPSSQVGEIKNYFIENLAAMLDSGISISQALSSLSQETRSRKLRSLIVYINEEVDSGTPLWKVFEQIHLLPEYALSLIRVGEKSGTLSRNMEIIAEQQRKEAALAGKVKTAMAYPILVLSITFVVALGVSWFILPRFVSIFANLQLNLPLTTRMLIALGKFISHYGVIAVPALFFVVLLIVSVLFILPRTRFLGEKLLFQISIARNIIMQTQISRLTFLLGTLLKAGIPINDALSAVAETTSNHYYRRLLKFLEKRIQEGDSFRKAFNAYKGSERFIPLTFQQMIASAEQTGKLPETFLRISDSFEDKIDNSTKTLASTLEPLLLVFIWLGVVFVAVSIILPIYSLIGGLNSGDASGAAPPAAATSEAETPTVIPTSSSSPTASVLPSSSPSPTSRATPVTTHIPTP